MKKLVFVCAAFIAVSFSACGNKAAKSETAAQADSTVVTETKACCKEACDSAKTCEANCDSTVQKENACENNCQASENNENACKSNCKAADNKDHGCKNHCK